MDKDKFIEDEICELQLEIYNRKQMLNFKIEELKKDIEAYGIDKFSQKCSLVERCVPQRIPLPCPLKPFLFLQCPVLDPCLAILSFVMNCSIDVVTRLPFFKPNGFIYISIRATRFRIIAIL